MSDSRAFFASFLIITRMAIYDYDYNAISARSTQSVKANLDFPDTISTSSGAESVEFIDSVEKQN